MALNPPVGHPPYVFLTRGSSTYALFVSATIIIFLTYARTVGILELFLLTHADLRADIIFNACEGI